MTATQPTGSAFLLAQCTMLYSEAPGLVEGRSMPLAPIVVFAYKRPDHTSRLLRSLRTNPETDASQVYAFCDGARDASEAAAVARTREAIRTSGLKNLEVIERPRNMGLAANVIDGVTYVCGAHGRVIVLEDDLVLSKTFLEYMNAALDRYAEEPRVFHVSGFMYPVELSVPEDAVFLPFISSWGWATWSRAWECFDAAATGHDRVLSDRAVRRRFDLDESYTFSRMLRAYLAQRNNSWAIRWYLSVFLRNGLALFPRESLVENRGFGEDATHCEGPAPRHTLSRARDYVVRTFPTAAIDPEAYRLVRSVMGADSTVFARAARRLRRETGRARLLLSRTRRTQ